jgi:hypothetical protein
MRRFVLGADLLVDTNVMPGTFRIGVSFEKIIVVAIPRVRREPGTD